MPLKEYHCKRSFDRTQEPKGKVKSSSGSAYLIQKHDASRLHYDLRLELDGVLKSWAVPKGPSLNPKEKRLAVEVEDHPVEYGSFEGVIPEGEYGGGAVLLWDRGEWTPVGDARKALRAGRLKFTLRGERLRGGWMLVRLRSDRKRGGKPNWLLIKERDDHADDGTADVLEEFDTSVATGRSMKEIQAGKAARSRSRPRAKSRKASARRSTPRATSTRKRASSAALPLRPQAQLATLVAAPPEGNEWLHEVKFDGYRMFARLDGQKVRWISRNGLDWTKRLRTLSDAVVGLPCDQCLLDGEVVVFDDQGVSRFELLQRALSGEPPDAQLTYCVFDCLFLDGSDLRTTTLSERKATLKRLVEAQSPRSHQLLYSDHILGHGAELQEKACSEQWEGIVSKLAESTYRPGRSMTWVKSKCRQGQELVIGGYTDPEGARTGFGSLLMGFFRGGEFVYAGRVGTGFSGATLRQLSTRLKQLELRTSPFAKWPDGFSRRGVHWVRPALVAQIEFSNWTGDGLLRQGAFMGLREDKPAESVTLESPKTARRRPPLVKGVELDQSKRDDLPSLSHPDRVLFPQEGVTKQDVADYYSTVAEWILPHLENRPLSLVRCPDGIYKKCFFQKHPPKGLSEQVPRIALREASGMDTYLYIQDLGGIVSLVQFGVIELHCWNSRTDDLERPDRIVFDLDPADDVAWSDVVSAALGLRAILEAVELESFLKTTGGKGLHIVVPIQRRVSWSDVKAFARGVANAMVTSVPDKFTTNMSKQARTGKVFVDYLRNERGSTAIAPYSLRARKTAPVAMPIPWDAIDKLAGSGQYPLEQALTLLRRRRKDPWAALPKVRQSITAAMRKKFSGA